MAADILLYRASHVPIGDDQAQHLELARNLAKAINRHVGRSFFPLPETNVPRVGARIRDLKYPEKKMSKSSNSVGTVWLVDDEERTRATFMRATTDSLGVVRHDLDTQPGVANLIEIAATILGVTIDEAVAKAPTRYGELKEWVAEIVNDELRPVRERFAALKDDPSTVIAELEAGAARARNDAEMVIGELRKLIGYVNA
jgi:tryptophanyl-tRNA synthetase